MKLNYNRPEQCGITYEMYLKEYNERYPSYGTEKGFEHKTDCGEAGGEGCSCWVCKSLEWRLDARPVYVEPIRSRRSEDGESSVTVSVIKVLLVLGLIIWATKQLTKDSPKNTCQLPEQSMEKHWLYK